MKATSPKTTFSGQPPATESLTLNVDEWTLVAEGSKSMEFKVLAPNPSKRIVVYRKPQ